MTAPTRDPFVGRTIAHYDILARVGGGGMGVVYRARDTKLGRLVALKFLPSQWSHDEAARQRFVREAQAASATNHPSICTVHDIESTDDGQLFIVMAYYDGQTLKQRLEGGPLPIEDALDIATQIADGLAKAHAQGVVHRDVKPGNIILTEDGARIVDFGLATFADALKLTIEHSTLGTAAYMSPEQVRGESADARSDVWAVGVMLYEMIAGHVPFQGSHAEAIAYAIRHETPAPLRTARPDIPEEVEQLVFRALHKDASVRYQNGRELARALRQVRGLTLPVTEPVQAPSPARWRGAASQRRVRVSRAAIAVAGILVIATGALLTYVVWIPVERAHVVLAPFANETGDNDLEEYRFALTQSLTMALRDSPDLAVVPYGRVSEIAGRFHRPSIDPSSREVIAAIDASTGEASVVVPTLLRRGGEWRARLELRNSTTATSEWVYLTDPVTSSLNRETAYRLALSLAAPLEMHFRSRRSRMANWLRGLLVDGAAPSDGRLGSLEAARAFEEATSAYEALEYASARRAFEDAVRRAPRSPLARAWLGRVHLLMRDDNEAAEQADRAEALLGDGGPLVDRLFVRAVAAEARREYQAAEAQYRALADARPDEPVWRLELAAFLERRLRASDAVAAYHEALRLDPSQLRPRLELCRLYSPSRLNEPIEARTHVQAAVDGYRAIGARGGEAQSLLCRADTLRVGSDADRAEAWRSAESARTLFEQLGFTYNMARADYYLALVAGMQGRSRESVAMGMRALALARDAGNVVIQPLILLNLGSAQLNQGDAAGAAQSYQRAYEIYQEWREETRAAQIQANRGAMLIDYGNSDEGMRDLRNAIAVFQKYNDRDYEVFCLRAMATYYNNQGRYEEALTELSTARAIARQWNLTDKVTQVMTHLAISRFEMNDYATTLRLQLEALEAGTAVRDVETRIRLARTRTRLGDFTAAEADLARAEMELQEAPNESLRALALLVRGEWALEAGRLAEARENFTRASALWQEASPEVSAVEARAWLGKLDALDGRVNAGVTAIRTSLAAAERLGRLGLVVRCRLLLAEVEIARGRFEAAADVLAGIPADGGGRSIGPELRAAVHRALARVETGRGDTRAAATEDKAARSIVDRLRAAVPLDHRTSFDARPSIQQIVG